MTDPFESSKFSIAWAKDHVAEFGREVNLFLHDEDAHTFVTEPDADSVYNLVKFNLCKPMPRPLRGHASDAVVNLRAALDQAVCSVAALCLLPTHTTYFPIANDETLFKNTLNGRCGQLP